MANVKISALVAVSAANVSATDVIPITDADAGTPTTYKITMAQIRTAVLQASVGSGWGATDYLSLGAGTIPSTGMIRAGQGSLTGSSSPLLNSTATWNNAATTFTHILVNVTDTSSNAASLLIDLQVGGSSMFKVTKAGAGTFAAGLAATTGAFSGAVTLTKTSGALVANSGATTGAVRYELSNTSGALYWGVESSAGGGIFTGSAAYAAVFGTNVSQPIQIFTNSTLALTISTAQAVTFAGAVSGITTLAGTGAISGFTTLSLSSSLTLTGGVFKPKKITLTYGATVTIDASLGNVCYLDITNNTPFTMAAPTNPTDGQTITTFLDNTSGVTTGTITSASGAGGFIGGFPATISAGQAHTMIWSYSSDMNRWAPTLFSTALSK